MKVKGSWQIESLREEGENVSHGEFMLQSLWFSDDWLKVRQLKVEKLSSGKRE